MRSACTINIIYEEDHIRCLSLQNLRMSLPLRIAVAFIFACLQIVSGAEHCAIWCQKATENAFLGCVSQKIISNRDLNIRRDVVDAMVKSLSAASSVINTPDNIKSEIMKGCLVGEVSGMVTALKSPGRNSNSILASIIGSIEECYIAVTGLPGTKFSSSINRAVVSSMLDDSDSDSNDYNPTPGNGLVSTNDYPNPPVVENSPRFPQNQVLPAIQPQKNLGAPQQFPFQSLPLPAASVASSSFQPTRQFAPNARDNINNRGPFQPTQRQDFSPPGSHEAPGAIAPQNRENNVPLQRQNFPIAGSPDFSRANAPQNNNNNALLKKQDFPTSGSSAFSSANVPQNRNSYAPPPRQDFPTSGSAASSNVNVPPNNNNNAPPKRQDFPISGSLPFSNANVPQNRDNYAPSPRQDFSTSNSLASSGDITPFQRQDFSAPSSIASSGANVPQNKNNYPPSPRQDFPTSGSSAISNPNIPRNRDYNAPPRQDFPISGSFASSGAKVPQNRNNYAPPLRQDLPTSGSAAISNANVPQNRDNYTPPPRRDFPTSGSSAISNANVPGNSNNYAPPSRRDTPTSGSSAISIANIPRNRDYYPPPRQDFPTFGSFASSGANVPQNGANYGANVPQNGANYALPPRQDFPTSGSIASASANTPRDNYTPIQDNWPPLNRDNYIPLQKQDSLAPNSYASTISKIGQNEYNSAPNNGAQPFQGNNNKRLPYSPVIPQNSLQPAPVIPGSNQPPFVPSPGSGANLEGPYNSNGIYSNNQPINYPIDRNVNRSPPGSNAVASSQSSTGGNNNAVQNYPETNNFKENIGPNEYNNGNNRWVPNGQPSYTPIPQSYDYNPFNYKNPSKQIPESNGGTFPLQQTPNQGNNQPNIPSTLDRPQDINSGTYQPVSNEQTSGLAQDNFNEEPQSQPDKEANTPANDYLVPQNGLSPEETEIQTTTLDDSQVPTTSATTEVPSTQEKNIDSNKSCALEFAEAVYVHLSESDSFTCMLNEDTAHDQAVSIASDALRNTFVNVGLEDYADKAKKYCNRLVSRLSSGATSQNYAEKISKAAMVVVYKNDLLDENCREAGKYMGEQILNAISDTPDSSNTDSEPNEEPQGRENNSSPSDSPSSASASAASSSEDSGGNPDNYNGQSDNAPDSASAASSAASQAPEENADNSPQRGLPQRLRIKYRRGRYPATSDDSNTPDDSGSGTSTNDETPIPSQNSNASPDYYNYPPTNNAPSSASASTTSGGVVPGNYNEPQSDDAPNTAFASSSAASQNQEAPVNNYPQRGFPKRPRNNRRRGGNPGNSDDNGPDDVGSGASTNDETPVPSQNSDGSPDYYNAPSGASAAAAAASSDSDKGFPDYYNGPQSDDAPNTASTGSSSGSQNQAAPVNNYAQRLLQRLRNKNRGRGGNTGNSDDNGPDDAGSGASTNDETPVLSQNSNGSPDYYNAPSGSSAAAAAASSDSDEGIPDYYNGPQSDDAPNTASASSSAASQNQEAPVNNYPQRGFPERPRNNRRRGGNAGNSDNNGPEDASSGASTNDETPVPLQNSDGSPDYYNAPSSASAAAASSGSDGETPDNYNGPQSDDAQNTASAGSSSASQKQGAPVNNYAQRLLQRLRNKNRGRGGNPGNSDDNGPDDGGSGASTSDETPVPSQNSNGSPDYNNPPETDDAASSASAAAISQDSNGRSPNNNEDNVPIKPGSNDQPLADDNQDQSGKENPLLNELKDPDDKSHIEHLMETAMNCVTPDSFNYKSFTTELAIVATAMKKEHPDTSPQAIMDKAYLAAIVALTQDLQKLMFDRPEPQSIPDSQPPPEVYRSNSDSFADGSSTDYQNSGSSAIAVADSQSEYGSSTDYQNSGSSAIAVADSQSEYGSSTDYQNSGSSAVAVVDSQSAPTDYYQNGGNYQNKFQAPSQLGSPFQTNTRPFLQNVGQNRWEVTNTGNNLLNGGPPPNIGYNQNRGFAFAAAG